jgi:hypothetical protein
MEFYEENIEYPNQSRSFPHIFGTKKSPPILDRYFRKNRHRTPRFPTCIRAIRPAHQSLSDLAVGKG